MSGTPFGRWFSIKSIWSQRKSWVITATNSESKNSNTESSTSFSAHSLCPFTLWCTSRNILLFTISNPLNTFNMFNVVFYWTAWSWWHGYSQASIEKSKNMSIMNTRGIAINTRCSLSFFCLFCRLIRYKVGTRRSTKCQYPAWTRWWATVKTVELSKKCVCISCNSTSSKFYWVWRLLK